MAKALQGEEAQTEDENSDSEDESEAETGDKVKLELLDPLSHVRLNQISSVELD